MAKPDNSRLAVNLQHSSPQLSAGNAGPESPFGWQPDLAGGQAVRKRIRFNGGFLSSIVEVMACGVLPDRFLQSPRLGGMEFVPVRPLLQDVVQLGFAPMVSRTWLDGGGRIACQENGSSCLEEPEKTHG